MSVERKPRSRKIATLKNKNDDANAIVRIATGLLGQVDVFLQTEDAKKRGFNSKADVVNEAVRQYLHSMGRL